MKKPLFVPVAIVLEHDKPMEMKVQTRSACPECGGLLYAGFSREHEITGAHANREDSSNVYLAVYYINLHIHQVYPTVFILSITTPSISSI